MNNHSLVGQKLKDYVLRMRFLLVAALLLLPSAAVSAPRTADSWCHPVDLSARILASPNPNDTARDWLGEDRVGLDTSIIPTKVTVTDGIKYYGADLYSEHGSFLEHIYVLASEWRCPQQAFRDAGL